MTVIIQWIKTFLCYFIPIFLILHFTNRKNKVSRTIYKNILIAYFLAITLPTILPTLWYGIESETNKPFFEFVFRTKEMRGHNLIPFRSVFCQLFGRNELLDEGDRRIWGLANLLGDLVTYIPIGLLLPITWKKFEHLHNVVVLVLLVSIIIEVLQFSLCYVGDIDDVIMHTISAVIGFCIYHFIPKTMTQTAK